MAHSYKPNDAKSRNTVGRALDSRWMMGLAVAAVLVAIVWALLDKGPAPTALDPELSVTVELLGVPSGAEVLLDGREIHNVRFGVSPGTRHLIEVTDDRGRSWRQVFATEGSLSLIVELRTHFIEVEVPPRD